MGSLSNPEAKGLKVHTVNVRVAKLWLQAPASVQSQSTQAIEVHVIEACEESPPEGEKPISWLLLTTIEVKDFELACQCLKWYSDRWLIERYHYCLKSGCRIEQLQLEDGERIKRAVKRQGAGSRGQGEGEESDMGSGSKGKDFTLLPAPCPSASLWRGFQRLNDIAGIWQLLYQGDF